MQVGIIGLGRMGLRIAEHLAEQNVQVFASDLDPANCAKAKRKGIYVFQNAKITVQHLEKPRVIIILVPAGKPVDSVLKNISPALSRGDIVIDAGNSFYLDSIRRGKKLKKKGINFLDMGTSGGLSGARNGACLTVGGDKKIFMKVKNLLSKIAAKNALLYAGKSGAGHFVKMVHNGIEYGFLQAIGEGLELVDAVSAKEKFNVDISALCRVWGKGSIIQSRLIDDAAELYRANPKLKGFPGIVGGGETGQWCSATAKKYRVSVPCLDVSLKERKKSKKHPRYSGKVIAGIRNVFGGHNQKGK